MIWSHHVHTDQEPAKPVTEDRWQEIERIFNATTELEHPQEQVELLNFMCAGDQSLHDEVSSLLSFDAHADTFMETPPADLAASLLDHLTGTGTE
ncbi:MAG: hypothetical protein EBY17_25190 [Acidobacteriia bacterium]|nr:hypothetical protein [Terriglobia bacterium]